MVRTTMIKYALALFLMINLVDAVDFTCPTKIVTPVTLGGNLPTGATNLTVFPKGTNCTFQFDIPSGYALLVQLSADFQFDNDTISTIDTTNTVRVINHPGKPFTTPIWFAATSAQIKVVGVSGNSKFFASYQYKFLNDYTQVKKATGEYFPLTLLSTKTYYTFTSASNDQVVATYGRRASDGVDAELDKIFVYDGADISTSKMVGTLNDFGSSTIMTSTGTSLTLVNFYGSRSTSYVLGNDASSLSDFFKYFVIMTTGGSQTTGSMGDFTGLIAGYTFICSDCSRYYLTKFIFDSRTLSNVGYAKLQGQTPTDKREKLINYDPMTYTSSQMPQLIPSDIFTLSLHLSKVNFTINTVNDDTDWKRPYEGRKGYIFSPNLWNNNANPNIFNYEFRNNSQVFNYVVNMDKMNFGGASDQMTLQIGSGTGTPQVNNVYSRDKTTKGQLASNGNYLKVGLTGSSTDDVRMSFEILRESSAATIGWLVSLVLTVVYFM